MRLLRSIKKRLGLKRPKMFGVPYLDWLQCLRHGLALPAMPEEGRAFVEFAAPFATRSKALNGTYDSLTHPAFKFHTVTEYTLDTKMYLATLLHLINRKTYDSMSAAQKKVIDDHCTPEWSQKVYKHWYDDQVQREDEIRKAGDKITKITAVGKAEIDQWRKAAEPIVASWKESVTKAGYNADQLLNEYTAELKKAEALY